MSTFLHSVAQRIFNERDGQLQDISVVFNNRRAGLFLQQQFLTLSKQPFFMPQIQGMDDLVAHLGKLQIVPHEFLLFELFDIHRNMEGIEQRFDTFEEFMPFGEMLLTDFSEVDLYRVDARSLFNNLHDLKRLGEWDISGKPLTPFQEKYLNFFRSLHRYYSLFRQRLENKQQAYAGMAYRHVADNIDHLTSLIDYRHIYFVGFNALSDSEATIIKHLSKTGMATLICDGDDYYFADNRQEAGNFLRKNALHFSGIGNFEKNFASHNKTIHIVNCPENVLQSKALGTVLGSHLNSAEDRRIQDSAIVLADEQLLLPVLNSLPPTVSSTNVTMGFPYPHTEIHALFTKIFSLYTNSRKDSFYHRDILAICGDNIMCRLLATNNLYHTVSKQIADLKLIYANRAEIASIINDITDSKEILYLFDNPKPTVANILGILKKTISLILNSTHLQLRTIEKESLACAVQIVDYIVSIQEGFEYFQSPDTLQRIYQRIAQRRNVAFYGEPLQGLQILGMLETRNLDFDTIYLLSLNEGTLPGGRKDNSLIPLSLKKAFGLPTYEEKDSVYAYNFFRLLQRCHEAWLFFCSDSEGVGKGEPSRFILQLKDEMAPRLPNITIIEHSAQANSLEGTAAKQTTVIKDANTLKRLEQMANRGLSPSALNRYRQCPMFFFQQDILGAREQEEVSEQLEANELGTFIHAILCDIYNVDPNGIIKKETLTKCLEDIDAMVDERYRDEMLKGRDPEGKNHIYGEVAKMELRHFLKKEIELLDQGHTIQILLTEGELKMPLTVEYPDTSLSVNILGVTDRVDRLDGNLRIADYKSGNVNEAELSVTDAKLADHNIPDKWFQVMTYAWLYCRANHYNGDFQSGIFPLRALGKNFMPASWNKKSILDFNDIDNFEQLLNEILSEMYDPSAPIVATPSKKSCEHCPFAPSCPDAIS